MWPNRQKTADFSTFTEEILNGKLNFILVFTQKKSRVFFFKVSVILRKLRHKPADIYLFNVSDRSTRTMSEVCWKLTIKSPEVKFLLFGKFCYFLSYFCTLFLFYFFCHVGFLNRHLLYDYDLSLSDWM